MNKRMLVLVSAVLMAGCYSGAEKQAITASITEKPFGVYEGKPVTEYTIRNKNGMEISVINYGGTITRVITPDRNGQPGDVVLGFQTMDGYLQEGNRHFGSLVGRYGNRIGGAAFTIDGKKVYALC